jgi:hypothetical protein
MLMRDERPMDDSFMLDDVLNCVFVLFVLSYIVSDGVLRAGK